MMWYVWLSAVTPDTVYLYFTLYGTCGSLSLQWLYTFFVEQNTVLFIYFLHYHLIILSSEDLEPLALFFLQFSLTTTP